MNYDILFPGKSFTDLRTALSGNTDESCSLVLAAPVRSPEGKWRLLVREVHVAPENGYEIRSRISARLKPEFLLPLESRARKAGWSVIYCHTHPDQGFPEFSDIDDKAEAAWRVFLADRMPGRPHVAVVFGRNGVNARVVGTCERVRIVEVNENLIIHHEHEGEPVTEVYDRQVRAFGAEGQRKLHMLTVGIVGAGGTGSMVVEQLAHLGVQNFILLDMDHVEETNLNRLVGATREDIGCPKVEVAQRQIKRVLPEARVATHELDILDLNVWRHLLDADLVFGCIDAHGPRSLLNRMAYQYFLPVIDMGTGLAKGADGTLEIGGRVNYLGPDMPCLWCCQELSSAKVRRDFLNEREKAADPYFVDGKGAPQPAVISVNGVVASLAVTMALSVVAGIPVPHRILNYFGHRSRVSPSGPQKVPGCSICDWTEGQLGLGDEDKMPHRSII